MPRENNRILDNLEAFKKVDKSNMLATVEHLPDHVKFALKIPPVDIEPFKPNLIAILGMGGSAICGDILYVWLRQTINIPIIVVRGYEIPKMISSDSLVFAVSYSGNTEETLSAFEEAVSCGAKVISISTGGKLKERSEELDIPHIQITPEEELAPRAAIAYLLFPAIINLNKLGLLQDVELKKELEDAVLTLSNLSKQLGMSSKFESNIAKQIASKLHGQHPVIYSCGPFLPIAYRWQTQLNENSKITTRCGELPEINHNDIVGWDGEDDPDKYYLVLLRNRPSESDRMKKRIELTGNLAFSKAHEQIEVDSEGKYQLSRILSLMYIGDFTSVYLAVLRNKDPTPVGIIDELKRLMRK